MSAFAHSEPSISNLAAAEIWLYVLELKGGHYYVGQSSELDKRLRVHKGGGGSAWIRLHPVIRELVRQPTGTSVRKIAEGYENQWTLELMKLHGWEKVRGGFWCRQCPDQTRKGLFAHGHTQLVTGAESASKTKTVPEAIAVSQILRPISVVYKKRRSSVERGHPTA